MPNIKAHILCDSVLVKYPDSTNAERQKTDQWFPGAGGKEDWGATT